jgi:drug/metabolite transporter (DMT)-like permease
VGEKMSKYRVWLLLVATNLFWAGNYVFGKYVKFALFATLIIAPFAINQGMDISKIGPLALTGILYMAIFPSVFSYVFWNMSVRAIGINQAGISLNLIPVFTAIISVILGERITGTQVVGGLLVFMGVYLTSGMLDRKLEVARLEE